MKHPKFYYSRPKSNNNLLLPHLAMKYFQDSVIVK